MTTEKNQNTGHLFSAKALLEACAPVPIVLETFICGFREYGENNASRDIEKDNDCDRHQDACHWKMQRAFFNFITPYTTGTEEDGRNDETHFFPLPKQYVRCIVSKFLKILEEEYTGADHDDLLFLYYNILLSSNNKKQGCHDSDENGYATFRVPCPATASLENKDATKICPEIVIPVRVFPNHHDVGVQKVWEAGAALAEFLLTEPHHIRDRRIVEVGAGVGFTGLIAQACCHPKTVTLTDFSQATLDNMNHNLEVNTKLHGSHIFDNCVINHLDWRDFDTHKGVSAEFTAGERLVFKEATKLLDESEVLLAADILYDPSDVPLAVNLLNFFLCRSIQRDNGLPSSRKKLVIIAYTVRNAATFDRFLKEVKKHDIASEGIPRERIDNLPSFFPCYFQQPRRHVQIFFLTQ